MKRCSIWVETVSHKCTVLIPVSLFSTVELEAENVGNAWWHAGACFLLAIIFYSCVLTWWCNRTRMLTLCILLWLAIRGRAPESHVVGCFSFSYLLSRKICCLKIFIVFVDVSKSLQVNYLRNEHRLWAYNEQKNSCKFPLRCVYTFCCWHKVHSRSECLIIWHLSICFSFADRTKTLRTKQQKQRKSFRKYARSLRSLEESCPTECCSLMWESRVKHKNTLSKCYIWSFRS